MTLWPDLISQDNKSFPFQQRSHKLLYCPHWSFIFWKFQIALNGSWRFLLNSDVENVMGIRHCSHPSSNHFNSVIVRLFYAVDKVLEKATERKKLFCSCVQKYPSMRVGRVWWKKWACVPARGKQRKSTGRYQEQNSHQKWPLDPTLKSPESPKIAPPAGDKALTHESVRDILYSNLDNRKSTLAVHHDSVAASNPQTTALTPMTGTWTQRCWFPTALVSSITPCPKNL